MNALGMDIDKFKEINFSEFKKVEIGEENSIERIVYDSEYKSYSVGIKLKGIRQEKNISIEDVALKTGLSKADITKIENGLDFKLSELYRICEYGLLIKIESVLE